MSDLWQEICERRPDLSVLPVVVVGNKCDLPSKKIFEATARAFTSRLSSDVRYLEVSAKSNIRVTEIFRTLLELSGFPRCKAGGGALEDLAEGQSADDFERDPALRRVNTARARPLNRDVFRQKHEERNGHNSSRDNFDKQQSLITLATNSNGSDLKRNRSLRLKSPRNEKQSLDRRPSDELCKVGRSSSLIR
uniref:Small monomeric GTPase n=1 Tax=Heterorhabditis bacteriophora TaxID=37862 RepID=A0A1I7WX67_HETBA